MSNSKKTSLQELQQMDIDARLTGTAEAVTENARRLMVQTVSRVVLEITPLLAEGSSTALMCASQLVQQYTQVMTAAQRQGDMVTRNVMGNTCVALLAAMGIYTEQPYYVHFRDGMHVPLGSWNKRTVH